MTLQVSTLYPSKEGKKRSGREGSGSADNDNKLPPVNNAGHRSVGSAPTRINPPWRLRTNPPWRPRTNPQLRTNPPWRLRTNPQLRINPQPRTNPPWRLGTNPQLRINPQPRTNPPWRPPGPSSSTGFSQGLCIDLLFEN